MPKKQKLKQDADKAAEKSQHLRFGKAEITPDEASRMTKQQKRAMYAAAAARSAAHREIDQYEDDNVGTQALSEGEKAAETTHDISKSRYARKLKKKAKMQGKKRARTAKSSVQKPPAAQDAGASGTGRAVPTGFHAGNSGKKSVKVTMPRPFGYSGTDRRRQSGIQWHHCCEVWHGTGHRQRKIGGQYRSQRHCQFCKK